jgi:DNA-binding transcriptional LysR family regulator
MNLLKLRYFQAVCINKSVSAASEELHVSQPSLSAVIKELEQEFNVTLFIRQHKGMIMTEAGEILFNLSQNLLSHAEQVERTMLDLGNGKKVLRLGIPPMIGSLILPFIYGEYAVKTPNVELKITEAGTSEVKKLLKADRLDMILIPHNDQIEKEYSSAKVTEFEIVCCAHKNNQLKKLKTIEPSDLEKKNIVLFENSFFQTQQIKRWFSIKNVEPKVLLQTNQLSTLINLIETDKAVGFTFKQLLKDKINLTAIPMKEPMNINVSLVWKKENTLHTIKSFSVFMKTLKL